MPAKNNKMSGVSHDVSELSPTQTLLCGYGGIALPRTIFVPLNTLKNLYQTHDGTKPSEIFLERVKTGGIPSLWHSCGVDWFKIPVESVMRFSLYGQLKGINFKRPLAYSLATVLASTCTYPLDVIRARMTFDPIVNSSVPTTFANILSEDGFRGFYRGLTPSLLCMINSRAVGFVSNMFFEKYKIGSDFRSYFISKAVVSAIAHACTYPLDTIRKRMITDPSLKNMSMFEVGVKIHEKFGFKGLYSGFSVHMMRALPLAYLQQVTTIELMIFMKNFNTILNNIHYVKK